MSKLLLALAPTLLLALSVSPTALAKTRPLSEITKKTEARILRDNLKPNVACYKEILEDFQERKIKKADIYVTFDDPQVEGIGIGIAETDENYSCEGGEMRAWEAGKYEVVKKFR